MTNELVHYAIHNSDITSMQKLVSKAQSLIEELRYCVKVGFPVTNNVIEYEALLSSLRLAKKIRT